MRVIVTGSRYWRDKNVIHAALQELPQSTIVHGCASGADAIARSLALDLGHTVEDHWPNYVDYTFKDANLLRNQEMINAGADVVLAFPTPNSRGTWHCVTAAHKAGIPVKVYREGIA